VPIHAAAGHHRRSASHAGVISKEAIEVPEAAPRRSSRAERLIASAMGSRSIHGLTGRPLMWAYIWLRGQSSEADTAAATLQAYLYH
jgi:hypothetical protein